MNFTNGQVLLMILIPVVILIRRYINKKRKYTKSQLKNISDLAHANSFKAWSMGCELQQCRDYFDFLACQQNDSNSRELFRVLINACNTELKKINCIAKEWFELASYVDRGLLLMRDNVYGNPSINIRKEFNRNYRKSRKAASFFKKIKKAEQSMKIRNKNKFFLPDYSHGGSL